MTALLTLLKSSVPWYVRWLLILLVFVVTYMCGYLRGESKEQEKYAAVQAEAKTEFVIKKVVQERVTTKVVTQYVTKVKTVTKVIDAIKQGVSNYVTPHADAACSVSSGFVLVHDSAARAELPAAPSGTDDQPSGVALSTVADTVATNYGEYHLLTAQVKGLQYWICLQEKATNGTTSDVCTSWAKDNPDFDMNTKDIDKSVRSLFSK